MSQRNQKIKLKKRSRQSARIHRGFAMPVGPGSENSLVSFRDFADLKAKYFRFTGRIQRRPFIFRTLILMFAQFMFSIILYSNDRRIYFNQSYGICHHLRYHLRPAVHSGYLVQISLASGAVTTSVSPASCLPFPSFVTWPAMSCPSWDRIRRRRSSVNHGCILFRLVHGQGDVRR